MINTNEKMVPSVEEEAEIEEEEEEEEEEKKKKDEEEEATSSDNEEEEERVGKKEAGASSSGEKKKPSDVLNLNNEVVKMRKEVKRVKALIIRKLTRQIAALKRKKGNQAETERNQRRAARLLEEVHSMKKLPPDEVTKTALQKNFNFEQVCKNPKSSISDRAIARIATHPQFSKKIDGIKAAVKAFKEERMKGGKQGGHPKGQRRPEEGARLFPDTRQERKNEEKVYAPPVKQRMAESEEGVGVFKGAKKSKTKSRDNIHRQVKPESAGMESTLVKSSGAISSMKSKPQSKPEEKSFSLQSAPESVHESADEEVSDMESSDGEEKEYFDDSTEERFHKQSSQSEESDEDDFFIGKVSKFKKKKKDPGAEGEDKTEGKKDLGTLKSHKLQSELDELESRLKSKATAVQSFFCSSLAGAKGKRGGDKANGAGKPAAQGNSRAVGGLNGGFSKLSKFTKQEDRTSNSGSKLSRSLPEGRRPKPDRTESGSTGRGRGRGREDVRKQRDGRGRGFSHQPALHPSWEASKKRKEQQGQILAFQGKKIKFDDDD